MSTQDTIREQVTKHPVVLYMKGTPQFPQCGFSATVAEILKRCGVSDYLLGQRARDDRRSARASRSTRTGRRSRSSTSNGEFVGGCDIVREMYASGELQKVLAPQTA